MVSAARCFSTIKPPSVSYCSVCLFFLVFFFLVFCVLIFYFNFALICLLHVPPYSITAASSVYPPLKTSLNVSESVYEALSFATPILDSVVLNVRRVFTCPQVLPGTEFAGDLAPWGEVGRWEDVILCAILSMWAIFSNDWPDAEFICLGPAFCVSELFFNFLRHSNAMFYPHYQGDPELGSVG